MKIDEHRILANPAVSCSSGSPGGGSHLPGNSGGDAASAWVNHSPKKQTTRKIRRVSSGIKVQFQ